MKEEFLQYIWQFQLFYTDNLYTTDGKNVSIIKVGTHNTNAGPDFLHAQIKIDDTIWAGHVEIHVNSKDWFTHKHNVDEAYNAVVLHVVLESTKVAYTKANIKIPTLQLKVFEHVLKQYNNFECLPLNNVCAFSLFQIAELKKEMWFNRLVVERFEEKTNNVILQLLQTDTNWNESLYRTLAISFGGNINSKAFENLARYVPLKLVLAYSDSLVKIEALFFGVSGLLKETSCGYEAILWYEFKHLKLKHSLNVMNESEWKFGRMRPVNFPTIKIAQFAELYYSTPNLLSKIIYANSLEYIYQLFNIELHSFWDNKYTLHSESITVKKRLGADSVNCIIINAVVPFLFAYGTHHSNSVLKQFALEILEKLPAEKNSIISQWSQIGINSESSFKTQALLQLTSKYCKKKLCLKCNFGLEFFKEKQSVSH